MELFAEKTDIGRIKEILNEVMIGPARLESDVVSKIEDVFKKHGIQYKREVRIAPRCRVDLLVEGGIAIEVKKGKPNVKQVMAQVERYASSDMVTAIILVSERGLWANISESNGKVVEYIALSENWGITI